MRLPSAVQITESAARRAAAFFAIYALWLCAERLIAGPFSYLEMHDIGDSMIPRNMVVARSLLSDGPSYWLPSVLCGVDRLAQTHSYLTPSILFCLALPDWAAFTLALAASLFLGSYFTYRLCRDDLRLPAPAALVAGAANVWVYNSELLITQWGYAAVPFVIWALNRIEDSPRHRWSLAGALGLAYSGASVFATSTPFGLAGIVAWFALVQPRTGGFWARVALFCACSLALQGQPVWALLANLPDSQRAVAELGLPDSWRDAPRVLLGAAAQLLSRPVPVLLAAAGLAASRGRDRVLTRVTALLLASTFGAALLAYAAAFLPEALAPLRAFNFTRFNQLAPFLGAVAGALGLAAVQASSGGAPRAPAFALLGLFLLSLPGKVLAWHDWAFGGSFAANFQSRTLRDAFPASPPEPYRVATVLHGLYPMYASTYGLESVDGEANIYPRRYNLFWSKVIEPSASLRPALAAQLDSFRKIGTRVQLSLDTVEHEPAGLEVDRYYRLPLLSLANVRFLISRHPLVGGGLRPLLEQRSWAAMSKRERWRLRLRENLGGKSYFYLYENPRALPRFFVARRARVFRDDAALLDALGRASESELREEAFLIERDASRAPMPRGAGVGPGVRVESIRPDLIRLELSGRSAGVLVAANSFSPYWTCEVDGEPRVILPAYGAFWGVPIEPGDKLVEFRYDPPYRWRLWPFMGFARG